MNSEFAPFSFKDNNLFSQEFDDLYSSAKGAVEESEYVFINGNNLQDRFRELKDQTFYIGEIGFGVGINFLTTCRSWLKNSQKDQVLTFYSFDKYLFQLKDFKKILDTYPELKEYREEFEKSYPKNVKGVQKISLFEGRISLNLVIGDINQTQEYLELIKGVDAWFLDGFSPSKNPDLWSKKLFDLISHSCKRHATFATYTSAGTVKQSLRESGFDIKKINGFSNKRHMLKGISSSGQKITENPSKVAVIGSGIAGCLLSYSLAKKGLEVDLFEQSDDICSGASSHELLVAYPRLSSHDNAFGRFNLLSYLYAVNFYDNLKSTAWQKTGVLVLNHDQNSNKRQESLMQHRFDKDIYQHLSPEEASTISGISIELDGLLYRDAGYILPQQLCEVLIDSPNINLKTSSKIESLSRDQKITSFKIGNKEYKYKNVCLSTGSDTSKLLNIDGLSIKRGQTTHLEKDRNISGINLPICAKGYVSPIVNNIHVVGSSYSDLEHLDIVQEEHLSNLENLKIIHDGAVAVDSGKVGFRAVSKDHMPMVGEVDGIYINTCHGSRASISAPISAEIISSYILKEAPPLEIRELQALSPKRFN